jgi:hypothetical protein
MMKVTDTAKNFSLIFQITLRQIQNILILVLSPIRSPPYIFFASLMRSKFSLT